MPQRPSESARSQRLVARYADALTAEARTDARLVALDGDLSLDTGLTKFRAAFPGRFFECGIAEQDMVSQAGAMALAGLVPVVHSFACFLTTRANEQIYNNATEGTKVIYAGSLAGILPGGPGHSHQSVRDIAVMGCVPGISVIEPFCEAEVSAAVRWAVRDAVGPVYIRLVSLPWALGFEPPVIDALQPGRGTVLREGDEAVLIATGPVLVSQAWAAADLLAAAGIGATVLALPWLRGVDGHWLAALCERRAVFCIDNHLDGGQGQEVTVALAATGSPSRPHVLGVDRVPVCGSADEVLCRHGLDAVSIADRVRAAVQVHV